MGKNSYEVFNYRLRSGKSIERDIILSIIKQVITPSRLKTYRYIGLGSIFYTDFKLFHKELGIDDMISIEAVEYTEEIEENSEEFENRFQFNIPFKCIKLEMGATTDVIPRLTLGDKKSIVWLDYDGSLETYMFDDISEILKKVCNDSFFILTCNCSLPKYFHGQDSKEETQKKLNNFKQHFENLYPPEISQKDFTKLKRCELLRQMFHNKINQTLSNLNGVKLDTEKQVFQQLFYFRHQDKAPMLTFGGLLTSKQKLKKLDEEARFNFEFVSKCKNLTNIEPPIVTNREIDLMNKKLPASSQDDFLNDKDIRFIPKSVKEAYLKYYKYLPLYMETRGF
ncbi:O-methyltransferase [Microscilla marina]|uniref:Uncharacterized protein n=1 Tax=Microscilla marina ATCC 23134 TaxID=313606 RepID=A1ZY57_MICM2|nr:O-methyltransferase [Microscilla marina]EAY24709.1 hypothetical protein M23134_03019 [Microscilla marina ATCC 23134]